jgi:hypothetical protein
LRNQKKAARSELAALPYLMFVHRTNLSPTIPQSFVPVQYRLPQSKFVRKFAGSCHQTQAVIPTMTAKRMAKIVKNIRSTHTGGLDVHSEVCMLISHIFLRNLFGVNHALAILANPPLFQRNDPCCRGLSEVSKKKLKYLCGA